MVLFYIWPRFVPSNSHTVSDRLKSDDRDTINSIRRHSCYLSIVIIIIFISPNLILKKSKPHSAIIRRHNVENKQKLSRSQKIEFFSHRKRIKKKHWRRNHPRGAYWLNPPRYVKTYKIFVILLCPVFFSTYLQKNCHYQILILLTIWECGFGNGVEQDSKIKL